MGLPNKQTLFLESAELAKDTKQLAPLHVVELVVAENVVLRAPEAREDALHLIEVCMGSLLSTSVSTKSPSSMMKSARCRFMVRTKCRVLANAAEYLRETVSG